MKWISLALLVGLAFALSACQATQPRQPTVEGRFHVGGMSLYLRCFDARPAPDATPTVLLEHGIGRRATSEMWVAVQHDVAPFARVCRYDRAGVGKSDPPLHPHRTARAAVMVTIVPGPLDSVELEIGQSYQFGLTARDAYDNEIRELIPSLFDGAVYCHTRPSTAAG